MKNLQKFQRAQNPRRQRGAILIFCLVFLSILTVMGTSGMETTVLEERMSANMRDHSLAFQSAESALKNAEAWLLTQTALPIVSGDGSTRVWSEDAMDPSATDGKYWWDHANIDSDWWEEADGEVEGIVAIPGVAGVAAQPSYVIEEYRTVDNGGSLGTGTGEIPQSRTFHRITARGVGVNPNTVISVQATFVQSYNGS